MSESLRYLGLVGRYVRMERTEPHVADEAAIWSAEGTKSVGMEGTIAQVYDADPTKLVGGAHVVIVTDDGIGFDVWPGEQWRFTVWTSEEVAALFVPAVREQLDRKAAYQEQRARKYPR